MRANTTKDKEPRNWKVDVAIKSKALKFPRAKMVKLSQIVLKAIDSEVVLPFVRELSVLIIGDKEIAELNAAHRGKAKPTDVLSFPTFEPEEIRGKRRVSDTLQYSIGDLVISAETTMRQAKHFKVTPEEEFIRLVVHGILHLCGYDHEGVPASEAQQMRRKEQRLRKVVYASMDLSSPVVRAKKASTPRPVVKKSSTNGRRVKKSR